jgi:hypothetical protein
MRCHLPSIITNETLMPGWGDLETFQNTIRKLLYNIKMILRVLDDNSLLAIWQNLGNKSMNQ